MKRKKIKDPRPLRLQLLMELYRELDMELAALGEICNGCGTCCQFDKMDHILYASALERELIQTTPRPEDINADEALIAAGKRCPFQQHTQCHAREGRVLGCRLHFCHGPHTPHVEKLSEHYHEELKELHRRLDIDWDYRPLLPL